MFLNPKNTRPTDFQAAYDAEAKAVLRQVERDFAEGRSQIVWAVLTPMRGRQAAERDTAVTFIWAGAVLSLFLMAALWWAIDKFVLNHTIKNQTPFLYQGFFVMMVLVCILQFVFADKLLPQTDKPKHSAAYIHLDLLRETVTLTSQTARYPIIYPFQHQSILPKEKIPAFRLPESERGEYRALAERLQRKISTLTGLAFADNG